MQESAMPRHAGGGVRWTGPTGGNTPVNLPVHGPLEPPRAVCPDRRDGRTRRHGNRPRRPCKSYGQRRAVGAPRGENRALRRKPRAAARDEPAPVAHAEGREAPGSPLALSRSVESLVRGWGVVPVALSPAPAE